MNISINLSQKHLTAAVGVIVGLALIGGGLTVYVQAKDQVRSLTEQVTVKNAEISTLQTALSKTEEGKKQVEEAKKKSDSAAAANGRRATTAEADASAKASALASANAQLGSVNAQLSTANASLANVNRCVSMFNSIRPTITKYQNANVEENRYWNLADNNYVSNYSMYTHYVNLSNQQTDIANSLWPAISSTLNMVASGNCN